MNATIANKNINWRKEKPASKNSPQLANTLVQIGPLGECSPWLGEHCAYGEIEKIDETDGTKKFPPTPSRPTGEIFKARDSTLQTFFPAVLTPLYIRDDEIRAHWEDMKSSTIGSSSSSRANKWEKAPSFKPTAEEEIWVDNMTRESDDRIAKEQSSKFPLPSNVTIPSERQVQRSFALWMPAIGRNNRIAGINAAYGRCEVLSQDIDHFDKDRFSGVKDASHYCKATDDNLMYLPDSSAFFPWAYDGGINNPVLEKARLKHKHAPVRPIQFFYTQFLRDFDPTDPLSYEKSGPTYVRGSEATGEVLMAGLWKPGGLPWQSGAMNAEIEKSELENEWEVGDTDRDYPNRAGVPKHTLGGSFWASSTPLDVNYLLKRSLKHGDKIENSKLIQNIVNDQALDTVLFGVAYDIGDRLVQLTSNWGQETAQPKDGSERKSNTHLQWDEIYG